MRSEKTAFVDKRKNDLAQTFDIMQRFMVKKGILNSTMTTDEMQLFLNEEFEGLKIWWMNLQQ